jgi:hypothetical protein
VKSLETAYFWQAFPMADYEAEDIKKMDRIGLMDK